MVQQTSCLVAAELVQSWLAKNISLLYSPLPAGNQTYEGRVLSVYRAYFCRINTFDSGPDKERPSKSCGVCESNMNDIANLQDRMPWTQLQPVRGVQACRPSAAFCAGQRPTSSAICSLCCALLRAVASHSSNPNITVAATRHHMTAPDQLWPTLTTLPLQVALTRHELQNLDRSCTALD